MGWDRMGESLHCTVAVLSHSLACAHGWRPMGSEPPIINMDAEGFGGGGKSLRPLLVVCKTWTRHCPSTFVKGLGIVELCFDGASLRFLFWIPRVCLIVLSGGGLMGGAMAAAAAAAAAPPPRPPLVGVAAAIESIESIKGRWTDRLLLLAQLGAVIRLWPSHPPPSTHPPIHHNLDQPTVIDRSIDRLTRRTMRSQPRAAPLLTLRSIAARLAAPPGCVCVGLGLGLVRK